jgi:hypothetical protein
MKHEGLELLAFVVDQARTDAAQCCTSLSHSGVMVVSNGVARQPGEQWHGEHVG